MGGNRPKTRKIFIVLLAIVLAAAGGYYFVNSGGLLLFAPKMEKNYIEAYKLYTAEEDLVEIAVFFGADDTDGFRISKSEIYKTDNLLNRVKQALFILTGGAPAGYVNLLPEGTALREAFLDSNAILYADFTEEITLNHKGGTTGEYLTIYSIVNTVFYNFPSIKGLRILVDGKEADTIAGHISIKGILVPDTDYSRIIP